MIVSPGVVLVTGASGFLGRALCSAFTAAGYEVRALVRDPSSASSLAPIAHGGVFQAAMPDDIDVSAFSGEIAAVLHCAYTMRSKDRAIAEATNVLGTRRLRQLAQQHGVGRFVFVSSLSAHAEAQSLYGRTKWLLEQEMTAPEDTIVKPGTILGQGGVFARTTEMIRRLPFVPLLYGDHELQTIYIDDVVEALHTIVRENIEGEVVLAHPQAISLRRFYEGIIALEAPGKKLIPAPGGLALKAVSTLEKVGWHLPVSSENLLGIKYARYFDPRADLQRLGLNPLNFEQALARLKAHSAE